MGGKGKQTNRSNVPTPAQRKAQSERDKAKAAAHSSPQQMVNGADAKAGRRKAMRDQMGLPDRITPKFKCQIPAQFNGNTVYAVATVSINPGDSAIDPRLALMAAAYSKYRYRKLKVTWNPLGSAFAAANQTGQIAMAFLGNWYSSTAPNITTISERGPSELGKAWESARLDCPQKILQMERFIRSDTGGASLLDMNLNDILLEFGVAQTPSTSGLGYLELSGHLELWDDYVQNNTFPPRTNRIDVRNLGPLTVSSAAWFTVPFGILITDKLQNTHVTGVKVNPSNNNQLLVTGGTWHARLTGKCTSSASAMTAIAARIIVAGAVQELGGGNYNIGGGTFSVATFHITEDSWFTVPEDGIATVNVDVNITGTGTLSVTDMHLAITPY